MRKTGHFQVHKSYTKMCFPECDPAKHLEMIKHFEMKLDEFSGTLFGSAVPYNEVRDSNWVPSLNDWSLMNHVLILH